MTTGNQLTAAILSIAATTSFAADATFTIRTITPETALKAAQAALDRELQPGKASAGIRILPGVAAIAEDLEF